MKSVIRPLKPKGNGWEYLGTVPKQYTFGFEGYKYRYEDLLILSSVEVAIDKGGFSKGPEYHISISKYPEQRCSSSDALWVLNAFGIPEAEEDNHVPGGFVRNFWRPVNDNLVGLECPCKEEEPAIREDKGDFIWRG